MLLRKESSLVLVRRENVGEATGLDMMAGGTGRDWVLDEELDDWKVEAMHSTERRSLTVLLLEG